LTRVAVILHERLGTWAAQLRSRFQDRPVRVIETRSAQDLDRALAGLACPVVVIALGIDPADGLEQLERVLRLCPAARILILDSASCEGVSELAREMGATLAISGLVPPPVVAALVDRWVSQAAAQTAREGWSRAVAAETPTDAEGWIEAMHRD
jgi:chemotaxis response regulator CheB